jgi:predicted membrane protein
LSVLFIFSKNQLFISLIVCIILLVSISLISSPIFFISLCLLFLGSACSYFSKSLRCVIRVFSWDVWFFFTFFLFIHIFIYIYIVCIISPSNPLFLPSPSLPGRTCSALFFNYVEGKT